VTLESETEIVEPADKSEAKLAEASELMVTLARALHLVGTPAHRLEETLMLAAERLGVDVHVIALPTGLILSFENTPQPMTRVVRLPAGQIHLGLLSQLSAVSEDFIRGAYGPKEACQRIEGMLAAPPRWRPPATVLSYVLSGAAFSVFFGGDRREVIAGSCVGLAVGIVSVLLPAHLKRGRIFELVAAVAAAFVASVADYFVGATIEWVPLAAGLIILLPGITLVDAIEELAHGHLASGAARLAGVFVALLALTFGVVLGMKLGELLGELVPGEVALHAPQPLTVMSWGAALVVVAIGSTIRFKATPRDVAMIFVASALAVLVPHYGVEYAGDYAGAFVGALTLGFAANLYARLRNQPAELFLIPGLALLVPGSVGLRSMGALLSQHTDEGISAAFRMFMIAMALVAGLLFSNALSRERLSVDK
jgi:uncharacterized membrane protein YjjP (DUF1212 family)